MRHAPNNNSIARWRSKLAPVALWARPWAIPLARLNSGHLPSAGPKAVTLGRLLRDDLPVPPGFVITADAFQSWLRSAPRCESILAALDQCAPIGSPTAVELSRKCEEALAQLPFPSAAARAIRRALEALPEVRLWAVRSSATAEDLPGASFAGQYESFLNVSNAEVPDKVHGCWLSLFSPRALAYLFRNNLSPERVSMAVIVQQMIPAERAGVLFTAEPTAGDPHRMVIEGARGLGDQVVSGQVAPERVVLSRLLLDVLERSTGSTTGCGDGRAAPTPAAGCVAGAPPVSPVLEDELARRLAELGLRVERFLGGPADIEWAVCCGEIHLLQARPITGITQARTWEDRQIWTNLNTGEVLPDVVTPLTWSLLQAFLDPLLRSVFGVFGAELGCTTAAGLVAGRVYFNANTGLAALKHFSWVLNRVPNVAQALGGGQIEASPRLLQSLADEDLPDLGFRWPRYILSWPGILRNLLRHSPRRGDAWVAEFKQRMDKLVRMPLGTMSTAELVSLFDRQVREGFEGWDLLYLCTQAAALPVFQMACRNWLNDPQLNVGYRLFAGLGGVPEAEAGLALWRLAALARADSRTGSAVAAGHSWADTLPCLQHTEHGRDFVRAWDEFMAEHGHHSRGELELFNPRWAETPDYILGLVRGYLRSVDQLNPLANQRRLAAERQRLTGQCCQRLGPIKRWIFLRSLRRSQKLAINREEWKNQIVRQFAFLRQVLQTLGRRLHEQGILARHDDIFFLQASEIGPVASGKAGLDVRERVDARRKEYQVNLSRKPPPVVVGRFHVTTNAAVMPAANDKVLEGIPVSPGIATGPARVILRSDDHEQVLPGEIPVVPFTDPAWTPYFISAAGVVIDQGGILSHGSIVAREYGLPAVTNLGSATRLIHTGDLIQVDGNHGRVTILQRANRPR
ncbi:MAG TPA: PEP/pyruvate-binding domain-containing protein [Verrucomicrobiae bacterium]